MNGRSSLSAEEARRISLAAQGFTNARRRGLRSSVTDPLSRLQLLQIDSVNVFARSHYLPIFSRHGDYDPARLDSELWERGEYTEYWAHEAAFIPVTDRPLFSWRMHDFAERAARTGTWDRLAPTLTHVRERIGAEGPQLVRDLEGERPAPRGPWWDWSDTKRAVELLFATGEVATAGRQGFQRRYGLAHQVLPPAALHEIDRCDAQRRLIEKSTRALGVATLADLADYYRLRMADARAAVNSLAAEGTLMPVTVEGWTSAAGDPLPAWLHRDAQLPSRLAPDALLTPFDPVVWYRPRAERIFDFHYRIEIYTPKHRRQYGYYCLPLMVGGRLRGRIDLKADRAARTLIVQAAWQEPGAPAHTAETTVRLLSEAARWQDLDEVRWTGVGNLSLPDRWAPDGA